MTSIRLREHPEQTARTRNLDEVRQPRRFGLRDLAAPRRQTIIAAPHRVVVVAFDFDDPAVVGHLLELPVERARPETDLPAGRGLDRLADAVAVAFAVGEREENVKRAGSQR